MLGFIIKSVLNLFGFSSKEQSDKQIRKHSSNELIEWEKLRQHISQQSLASEMKHTHQEKNKYEKQESSTIEGEPFEQELKNKDKTNNIGYEIQNYYFLKEESKPEKNEAVKKKIQSKIKEEISCRVNRDLKSSIQEHQNPSLNQHRYFNDNDQAKRIRSFVESRGISYITHFTPIDNLSSILTDGILPRRLMDENFKHYVYTDLQRLDNKKNASCLSIGLPNYRYFFTLRKGRYQNRTWCVVLLDPAILWELDAAFYYTNAANNVVRHRSEEEFKNIQALKKMFDSSVFDRSFLERNYNLPSYCTTDPQAEVLIFDKISPSYIKGLVFENMVPYFEGNTGRVPCFPERSFGTNTFFGRRCDFAFWQNTQGVEANYG